MRDFVGWRARIGLIYMASSIVMEPEFQAMAPEGVSVHTTRIPFDKASSAGIGSMMDSDHLETAASLLATAPLTAAVFGGTSASFLKGKGFNDVVADRMRAVMGTIPVTTSSSAGLAALHAFGVERISFVGPYIEEVTQRGQAFFAQNGFRILAADGMGVAGDHEIGDIPLERVYDFTRRTVHPQSQAVFISCTNMRSVGAIEALEQDLGIPVVSAIQASFWHALLLSGVHADIRGFGSLFARHPGAGTAAS